MKYTLSVILTNLQKNINKNWMSPRKSGLTLETTNLRIVCYSIIKAPQKFSELIFHGDSKFLINFPFIYCKTISQ